jgi:DNA-binding helix-hairpin-helix protein with protein kinase domain
VSRLINSRGQEVQLANLIGRGGEAVVFDVRGRDDLAAKIYLPGKGNDGAKISAMLDVADQRLHSLGAWPTDTLCEEGKFVGFLMPKIEGHRPVFDLYVPKLRLQEFPQADWRFLVRAAENVARAFDFIHQAGVVIGDVNHSNLLVANDATVKCIDCDSFQISAGSERWLCRVGTGDYQPPEMQQLTSYEQVVRTPNHDNFGLAVTIFRLLFAGRHPFSGRYQGQGDAPSIEDAIKASLYAYSERRQIGLQPPANALPIDALPTDLRDMFELAFDPGTTNGGRPIAGAWMTALQTLGRNMRQCDAIRSHWFYSKAPNCPWCDIEQSGAAMFGGATQRQRPHPGPGRMPQPVPASQAIAPLRRVGFAIVGVLVLIGVVVNLASSNKATSIALSRPRAEPATEPTPFTDGQHDRQAWETWFTATTGDYRKGASWWARQRSLPRPGSCLALSGDARNGCLAAKDKLATSDVRRNANPDYWRGWNSY